MTTTENSNMAAQTGSTHISGISGTMIDSVKISTTNFGFSTTRVKESVPNDYDNDQQSEVTVWPPKPDILYSSGDTVNI